MDDHLEGRGAEAEGGAETEGSGPAEGGWPGGPIAGAVPTPSDVGSNTAAPVVPVREDGTSGPDPWAAFVLSQELQARKAAARRKKRTLVASGAALAIVAGAVVGTVVTSSGSNAPGSGMAPAAFVVSSTQTTLAQRTADVTYGGSVTADGHDIPISGSGEVDFDANAFSATLTERAPSTTIDLRELIESGQFYMGMSINGQDMSELTGGAHWASISLPDQASSTSLGATNVDPISHLKALEQKGATVTQLGTKTIDGITVSGYSVVPSRQEVQDQIQQEIQQNQISAAVGQQMEQAPNLLGTFTTEVWIDGSGLVRQENVNISGGDAGVTAKATVTFQNYGTPVSISPPAPDDVVPFQQFINDLQSSASSSTTS